VDGTAGVPKVAEMYTSAEPDCLTLIGQVGNWHYRSMQRATGTPSRGLIESGRTFQWTLRSRTSARYS
jgi:hypothetical protein